MTNLSVKVPKKIGTQLAAEARRRGKTKSAIVREAIDRYLSGDGNSKKTNRHAISCMDLMGDLAGCVSGPGDLSYNKRYMRDFGK